MEFLDALVGPVDRRAVLSAARAAQLLLNGDPVSPSTTLRLGDYVDLLLPAAALERQPAQELRTLYGDEQLLVLDKPSGVPFDASRSASGSSALERLAVEIDGGGRLRPVHRLDKDTSGVVVLARHAEAEQQLLDDLGRDAARVEYLALIRGRPLQEEGLIDAPLGKKRKSDQRLVIDERHGHPASTRYRLEEAFRGFSLLRLSPTANGRSHQVRAHLACAGHPALCDKAYGEDDRLLLSQLKLEYRPKRGRPERPLLQRPALHAAVFVGASGLRVTSPLPNDLEVLLAQLRRLRHPNAPPTPQAPAPGLD